MTGFLAVLSVLLWVPTWTGGSPLLGRNSSPLPGIDCPLWLALPVLVVAFFVAEETQLHFEVRRHTFSVSISEFPLVIGLFTVPPLALLTARLIGYGAVALQRRMSWDKAAMNVASFTTEVGLAAVVASAIADSSSVRSELDVSAWGAAYAGVLAAVTVGAIAVAVGISLLQRVLSRRELLELLLPTLLAAAFFTTTGLLTVILADASLWTIVGLLGLAGPLVVGFRYAGRLESEHKSLGELYELTRLVSATVRDGELDPTVLDRVRSLMRAEVAQLWLAENDQLVRQRAEQDHELGTTEPPDVVRRRVLDGESILVGLGTADWELNNALAARGIQELVAVPLRVGGSVVGSLEVLDRQGERSHFVASDQALLETLAVHTGIALENARLVARLRHEADHDPLTGLPNRKAFVERLDVTLRANQGGDLTAVLVLDLTSFKDVNDTLGRAAGDALLREVVALVRSAAPDARAIARLSSDEFGVFVDVPDMVSARDAAYAFQRALTTPIAAAGYEIELSAAVGIAVYPEHGTDALTLLQRADVAMYAAKRTSRGVLAYSPTMDAPSVRRFGLVAEMRRALEAGDLEVWYQPQVRLDQSELVGLEALVRWTHADHGAIPPDEFVPVAEHTGLIGPLTSFVLNRALSDLRAWQDQGHEFGISVNISVRSLLDPGFADEVRTALLVNGVAAPQLTLELTESSVMNDPERALPVLQQIEDMGVRLSVDDFGIGQSSLTYLRRLPVGEVKIDRSFVSGMVHDKGDFAIVRAVIDLSRPLGLTVVAEGVESEETRRELTELGCDVIQGYLLSRPLSRSGIDGWLDRRTVAMTSRVAGRTRWLRVVS